MPLRQLGVKGLAAGKALVVDHGGGDAVLAGEGHQGAAAAGQRLLPRLALLGQAHHQRVVVALNDLEIEHTGHLFHHG